MLIILIQDTTDHQFCLILIMIPVKNIRRVLPDENVMRGVMIEAGLAIGNEYWTCIAVRLIAVRQTENTYGVSDDMSS